MAMVEGRRGSRLARARSHSGGAMRKREKKI
jgi:hypothetical protein